MVLHGEGESEWHLAKCSYSAALCVVMSVGGVHGGGGSGTDMHHWLQGRRVVRACLVTPYWLPAACQSLVVSDDDDLISHAGRPQGLKPVHCIVTVRAQNCAS